LQHDANDQLVQEYYDFLQRENEKLIESIGRREGEIRE
jgi:hypothetical protein